MNHKSKILKIQDAKKYTCLQEAISKVFKNG